MNALLGAASCEDKRQTEANNDTVGGNVSQHVITWTQHVVMHNDMFIGWLKKSKKKPLFRMKGRLDVMTRDVSIIQVSLM